ncbi:uncharacterized protein GGS22DRAFT_103533 [Annulohypoxylon maeteangense]|uniref:uncharacterized protein n=1 Tax=Annulohypoxylon maeteangense TaxID=1927788 RepID=UPI002007DA51|nr:uncharacterized protein GGS22DRAFT_103533 [Annulohypoxylon maeteangense]KAI0879863.1 hypothetical protein GGS22DRAFT_103533 [Annulohypoxylon maeteangense]
MKKLSPFIYLYEPVTIITTHRPSLETPKLILIASWMDAQDLHIAKYITHYQSIYPTSKILLVKFVLKESVSASFTRKVVDPALVYLHSLIDSGTLSSSPPQPEILVHIFSNGGSATTRTLYQLFRAQTGYAFPLHAAVYDSCPGVYSFTSVYSVFMVNFSGLVARAVAAPFVSILVLWFWIWYRPLKILSGEDFLSANSRVHNDVDLVQQTNRSYIYGKADVMVDWRHVERHANHAAAKGLVVRREMFEHGPHVSHMRTDGDRYWKIVKETWKKGTMRH